jgi:histidyl-tRNA synthetase
MAPSVDALNAQLAQQTELFNKLRIENSDPVALEESRKRLGEIKRELASLKPGGKDAKKKERLLLKTPKVRHPSCCCCWC